jgi:NDP-sugar pyrophosphorylase family protein
MGYIPEEPYYWRDIGTVQSYWEAHRDILEKKLYRVENITGNHICHNSSHIGDEVTLEGFSVTGKDVKISGNIKIKNSIIWNNVEISGSHHIENAIVTKDLIINKE